MFIGPSDEETNSFSHELRGVIPRSFEYLFSLINREKQKVSQYKQSLCIYFLSLCIHSGFYASILVSMDLFL